MLRAWIGQSYFYHSVSLQVTVFNVCPSCWQKLNPIQSQISKVHTNHWSSIHISFMLSYFCIHYLHTRGNVWRPINMEHSTIQHKRDPLAHNVCTEHDAKTLICLHIIHIPPFPAYPCAYAQVSCAIFVSASTTTTLSSKLQPINLQTCISLKYWK